MGENGSFFGSDWLGAFLIIAVLFGGFGGFGFGGNGAAAAYDVNQAISNQSIMQSLGAIQLSSANNNYETARLISEQNMTMMNQSNTNLLTAVNGFNAISANIASGFNSVNQNIADLGYKLENCCCSIKTLIKDNQIADLTNQLNQANNVAVNSAQSQYLLSQLGHFVPYAPAASV